MGVLADIKQWISDNHRYPCLDTDTAIDKQAKLLRKAFADQPEWQDVMHAALITREKPVKPFKAEVYAFIRGYVNASAFIRAVAKSTPKETTPPSKSAVSIQMDTQECATGPWGKLLIDGVPVAQLWFEKQALHLTMPALRALGIKIDKG